MSSDTNETVERRQVSKVSFSPISSELMVVRIRKSEAKEEEIPTMSQIPQSVLQATPPANPQKPSKRRKDKSNSRSTMTDKRETSSTSSQTTKEEEKVKIGGGGSKNEHTPCMRHAAENLSRKASEPPSGRISMCNNCSKSMLSYIFLVQDFLDSLAIEIRGGETPVCLQCAREEARNLAAVSSDIKHDDISTRGVHSKSNQNNSESRHKDVSSSAHANKQPSRTKSHRSEHRRHDDYHKDSTHYPQQSHSNEHQQNQRTTTSYSVQSASNTFQDNKPPHSGTSGNEHKVGAAQKLNFESSEQQQHNIEHKNPAHHHLSGNDNQEVHQNNRNDVYNNTVKTAANEHHAGVHSHESGNSHEIHHSQHRDDYERPIFKAPMERRQPVYEPVGPRSPDIQHRDSSNFHAQSPSLYRDDVDGIISTLSNVEREIYESARNKAGWEGFTEPQERYALPPSSNLIASEAFVTSCRNNAEALGCLVVGTSLLLCRSSRTLCVLVADGVSTAFRNALSAVFQVVQFTRSLDSLGTTKLALLEQPELGVSFEKLNIWRLTQFTKCVYLNPDTLVIQNCDELFGRDELSAVPDIGWPDCFNSGVFVYSPSVDTFWKLMEFAEKQGSYDGGDQGILNSYFSSWSNDINKKLSFIYNLMANVSYTYTPAFKQFGRDVKIVQFHGSFKPWHVKFFSKTGQISPSSPVHPTYVQFVHIWLSIFRISVLRILPKNIQSYAASEDTICAVETLRFFPLPTESEADFFLTPPSVRLRRGEIKLNKSTNLPLSEAIRRKSAEYSRYVDPEEEIIPELKTPQKDQEMIPESKTPQKDGEETSEVPMSDDGGDAASGDAAMGELEEETSQTGEVFKDSKAKGKKVRDKNAIPGSDVGDYQGMKAWEQGRMDYQGTDSSDNVMKRLDFLMAKSKS